MKKFNPSLAPKTYMPARVNRSIYFLRVFFLSWSIVFKAAMFFSRLLLAVKLDVNSQHSSSHESMELSRKPLNQWSYLLSHSSYSLLINSYPNSHPLAPLMSFTYFIHNSLSSFTFHPNSPLIIINHQILTATDISHHNHLSNVLLSIIVYLLRFISLSL